MNFSLLYGLPLPQVEQLQTVLQARFPSPRTFCHADLQYGNVLLQEQQYSSVLQGQEQHSGGPAHASTGTAEAAGAARAAGPRPMIRLIDYDYVAFGPAAFDLANHWWAP